MIQYLHQTQVREKRWWARERPPSLPSDICSIGNQPDLRLILVFLAVDMAIQG
jgi:hypothetical protein